MQSHKPTAFSDTDRELIDQTLRYVAERAWRVTDTEFFCDLVKFLGESLDVTFAFCDFIDQTDDTMVTTLALFAHGEISENISYKLKGTPCENVIGRTICCYVDNVQKLFPKDQLLVDLSAESYAGIPLWSADGKPLGLIAVMDDKPLRSPDLVKTLLQIVAVRAGAELERSQVLKQLRMNERRFADFAESSSDWFWEMDEDLRFSYFSDRLTEISGVAYEDLFGKTRLESGLDLGDEWVQRNIEDLDAHRPFKNFEHSRVRADGTVVYMSTSGAPIFDEDGAFKGYRGIGTDITERKQTEGALRENENLLNSIIENVPVALLIKDSHHVVERANSTYLNWYGFDVGIMEGRRSDEIEGFQPAEEVEEMNAQEREVLSTGITQVRQVERPFADGQIHTINITKFPVYDQQGNIIKVGSVGFDLTEQVQANKAKSEFLAAMSHDLRTPLNAIIGFSDFISQQYFGPVGDKYQEYAKDIKSSGEFLLSLVNDILDLSVIESGKQPLAKENISIIDVVTECETIIEERAKALGIDLVMKVSKDLPPLYADRRAITQILLNLLSNSIKFTTEGGKITLSATATNEHHTIAVSDTGIGILDDRIATITNLFVKGETDPHHTQEGTGLGLAIVKSLVDLHDGELDIKSTVGKGTTVIVRLPNGES